MSDVLLLCAILIPLAITLLIVFGTVRNGIIGPSPTTQKQKRAIFTALPEEVAGNIYELGSGWGGLAVALARRYPQCNVTGVENSPVPFLYARLRRQFARLPNLHFHWGNLLDESLENAALIVCYLHTGAMKRLKVKLEKELHGDTIIVSNTFSFHGWEAIRTVEINDIYRSRVFVYRR